MGEPIVTPTRFAWQEKQMIIRPYRFSTGGGAPSGSVALSFESNGTLPDANPTTFSGYAIGTPAADRQVIVYLANRQNTITGMTIGGVTATRVAIDEDSTWKAEIWIANVPTGTTADIVISGPSTRWLGICVYAATGISATPTDTGGGGAYGSPLSDTLTAVAGGICIVGMINNGTDLGHNYTSVTRDAVQESDNATDSYSSGSLDSTGTSVAITVSSDAGNNRMVAATFPPAA
jgi:hypothetical protein